MNDRNLGYGVILFLVLFCVLIAAYVSFKVFAPVNNYTIIFDTANSLSFLKKQDPVRLRGVEAGQIRNIFLKEDITCVEIETRRPLDIHRGYRIFAEAKGFMGDRYIEINPGDMRAPDIALNKPLIGIFPLGPTEAIAYTAELKTKVRSLIKLTDELRSGSPGKKRLDSSLFGMAKKIDSISLSLTRLLSKANHFAAENADTFASFMEKTNELSIKLGKTAPAAMVTLEKSLEKAGRFLITADSLAVSCSLLLERMKTWEAGALSDDIKKLRQQITVLRNSINEVREHGLRLPVKL